MAAPLAPHVREHRVRAQVDGLEVHRDRLVEVGLGQIVNAAPFGDAGVVDEHVDGAERALDRGDHIGNGSGPADIRRQIGRAHV